MADKTKNILDAFAFSFSPSSIAQTPASPRDAAKLLVYRKSDKKVSCDTFKNLAKYLPARAVLVFNETKVIPARLFVRKETGGWVEVLYIATKKGLLQVLADRKLVLRSKARLTEDISFTITKSDGRFYYLKPSFPISKLQMVLERYGAAPVPPYIKHSRKASMRLREQYQAIFAKKYGSIAAPTASLHFTKRLIVDLKRQSFGIEFVTLHVGLGTFAPVTDEQLKQGKLHSEWYSIDADTARRLNAAKRAGRPIIAVGTTVVRTLESAALSRSARRRRHSLRATSSSTELFIRPGYRFKFVDGLITNFHVPRSSLMMLVAAFISRKELLALYRKAMKRKFRFFSFGDGMLLY
ncbi:MAG: tRNA preQ1(34) S-adenosylmethionine ribosyltransferase-isomerase QueA [Candidatus Komeilibacteria bacterium RIFCSPLOWO2_01_FULL_53_11]|uniref:S-adenosylmethionine:tRNA ribosyltransferase-isomerase n=1 Tax=Candidatus Komeilibacteria bacterium RIFCSPLOWO2_01_FULL_53_11 TaxID=1798552 RepID=A0A1G2BRA4_9BACT|nr:MAG: tRNA preQ1(34) S-adenosylmethionine ribosyltransferase-isomerase QueA [Candidatus Komeilibacteria bacterium RIFCSPLOWO2_01_FULL_53_11]